MYICFFSWGYNVIASIFYMLAAGCVLYCQESVYRLNAVICTVFIIMALHQFLTPFLLRPQSIEDIDKPTENLVEKIEKLEKELKNPPNTQ